MKKSFGYLASLISSIVTGIESCVLIAIITGQALLLKSLNDQSGLLEIGLNATILAVSIIAFGLSIYCNKLQKDEKYLSLYKNRRTVYASMVFDYILAFLFFTYCLIETNILVIVLYVLCLILLALAGSLFLAETNQYFKQKKMELEENNIYKEEKIETE